MNLNIKTQIPYPKRTALTELAIIIISACTIKLSMMIDQSDNQGFTYGWLKYILYGFDFGVNIAIVINNDCNDSVLVLYIMKTLFLLWLGFSQMIFNIAFYVPIIAYYTYKALCFIQIQSMVSINSNKSSNNTNKGKDQKQKDKEQQTKKRIINYYSLVAVMLVLSSYLTYMSYGYMSSVIFISFVVGFVYQVGYIGKAEQILTKVISNYVVYNLYIYVIVSLLCGKMYYGEYFLHLGPLLTFLSLFFVMVRVYIGCYSDKFHGGDRYLFEITYIFKNKQYSGSYIKTLNNEKILRLLDNITRQIALIIYLLGFVHVILAQRYCFFLIGLYLINKYQLQTNPSFLIMSNLAILKQKGYNFHFNLSFPLLTSILYFIFFTENEQIQILFDTINQCSSFHHYFISYIVIMTTLSLILQITSQQLQQIIMNLLQFTCPLMIFFTIYNLQCMNIQLLLIMLYTFGLIFQAIKNKQWSDHKNEKQY